MDELNITDETRGFNPGKVSEFLISEARLHRQSPTHHTTTHMYHTGHQRFCTILHVMGNFRKMKKTSDYRIEPIPSRSFFDGK